MESIKYIIANKNLKQLSFLKEEERERDACACAYTTIHSHIHNHPPH